MIIKKFSAKTEEEAVIAAKKELGDNVVIMNVKNAKKTGFFQLFKPQLVEVTVVLEEESERAPVIIREIKEKDVSTEKNQVTGLERIKEVQGDPSDQSIEKKLDSLQQLIEKQLLTPTVSETTKEKTKEKTKEETEEETKEQQQVMKLSKLLYNTLLENEVSQIYANQIIDGLEKNISPNVSIDYLLSNVYQKTILKFGLSEGLKEAEQKPKVAIFVGPTGVGKTTTIAKLASKLVVEEKKNVGLITTDTYRIAAAEQLRTYATILNVPFRVVYTKEELDEAIKEFKRCDYLFVDTAGHSYKNEEQRENTKEFIRDLDVSIEKEVYLVISATTKYKDLLKIVDSYGEIGEYKLVFTKLDETSSFGNLLNIRLHTGAKMSYVTYGQNVPDDIEEFSPQKTVRMLLGGKKSS